MTEYIRSELPGQNPAKDELDVLPDDISEKIISGTPEEATAAVEQLNELGIPLSDEAISLLNLRWNINNGRGY